MTKNFVDPGSDEEGDALPILDFRNCHSGIVENLDVLRVLRDALPQHRELKKKIKDLIGFFDKIVIEHHSEEEHDLFPMVMRACSSSNDLRLNEGFVEKLKGEHRAIEDVWRGLSPELNKYVKSGYTEFHDDRLSTLIEMYSRHANFEETVYLPFAQRVLRESDPDLEALANAIHMRHVVRAARRGFRGS